MSKRPNTQNLEPPSKPRLRISQSWKNSQSRAACVCILKHFHWFFGWLSRIQGGVIASNSSLVSFEFTEISKHPRPIHDAACWIILPQYTLSRFSEPTLIPKMCVISEYSIIMLHQTCLKTICDVTNVIIASFNARASISALTAQSLNVQINFWLAPSLNSKFRHLD